MFVCSLPILIQSARVVNPNRICSSSLTQVSAHASDVEDVNDNGYMADGELDACDYEDQPRASSDHRLLITTNGLPDALEALAKKNNEDFFARADDEERRKRAAAKAEEELWWSTSKPLLLKYLFEFLSEVPLGRCGCDSEEAITVFTIDIKGKRLCLSALIWFLLSIRLSGTSVLLHSAAASKRVLSQHTQS